MIAGSYDHFSTGTARDHEIGPAGRRERPACRDAPTLNAGARATQYQDQLKAKRHWGYAA
jgi:hypothetical protein